MTREMAAPAHEFAFYVEHLGKLVAIHAQPTVEYTIDDPMLYHRIVHVLRLQVGRRGILFDQLNHGVLTILDIAKKSVTGSVDVVVQNSIISPHITFCVPLLKRDALDQALY